jgi:hypothetical protein
MRTNLLETYARQLKVAEAYVAKNFNGKAVSANTQLTTAVLLDNTNRWMTESMNTGLAGAQRTDLGDWKKFCLNLTNIAVPSLIANDLVIVHPMTSYSGSVAYLKYVALTDKNGMAGKELNSVFGLGVMDDARMNYTSQIVVESGSSPMLPAEEKGMSYVDGNTVKYATYKVVGTKTVEDETVAFEEYVDTIPSGDGVVVSKIAYVSKKFQMNHTPATEIPTIGPKMERIALVAEPRRIAVKYDQITAFQAKTDYGFSLDKQIAEQACGELAYEIDTEIVDMLYKAAFARKKADGSVEKVTFDKTQPIGVSKFEHYNAFLEVVEEAKAIIYKRTRKFHPNYMVIGCDVLPVLKFVNGFTAVKNAKMNGPYKVGELDGMAVYVSPAIGNSEFFFGLNGSDMMSSAGVYAPYMAIVPTQLLGTPDGGLAQGFSTWYAKALLNDALLVAGEIIGGGLQAH